MKTDMPPNWETAAYPGVPEVRLLRSISGLCPDCNHPSGPHWGEDDYVAHRCRQCPEHATMEGDALICPCGNEPAMSGFAPCLEDGTEVEAVIDGPWQGKLYICLDCGRIINAGTLEVAGFRSIGGESG